MVMISRFAVLVLMLTLTVHPVSADEAEVGLQAYDAGDYRTAVAHWRAASEAGNTAAMVALADLHVQGLGVPRDIDAGVRWYRAAAERGNGNAQLVLGGLLSEGTLVARDRIEAYKWLGLAARQGSTWARRRLSALAVRMSTDDVREAKARIAGWRSKKD